MTLVMENLGV